MQPIDVQPVPIDGAEASQASSTGGSNAGRPIGLRTWLRFLVGRRDAIERIAGGRGVLLVGLLFVLSAGFAREYDNEDLGREPWHLLIPAAASVGLSFLLYVAFWPGIARAHRPRFWSGYRGFLALFWMTAPMAWLYAVPYERLLDAGDSVRANLWSLAIVAGWRVALISRVLSVLTRRPAWQVLVVVLAVSDAIVQIALTQANLPVLSIMGGVRLSEGERLLADITFLIQVFGFLALLVLLPAAGSILVAGRNNQPGVAVVGVPAQLPAAAVGRAGTASRASRPMVLLAVASVVVWAAILPLTQPEQRLRWEVEHELNSGRMASAVELMSTFPREAFPPHWDPPPRIGYRVEQPKLLDVMDALVDTRGSPWVRQAYLDKFVRGYLAFPQRRWLREADAARVSSLLDRLPEGAALRQTYGPDPEDDRSPATHPATGPVTLPTPVSPASAPAPVNAGP